MMYPLIKYKAQPSQIQTQLNPSDLNKSICLHFLLWNQCSLNGCRARECLNSPAFQIERHAHSLNSFSPFLMTRWKCLWTHVLCISIMPVDEKLANNCCPAAKNRSSSSLIKPPLPKDGLCHQSLILQIVNSCSSWAGFLYIHLLSRIWNCLWTVS